MSSIVFLSNILTYSFTSSSGSYNVKKKQKKTQHKFEIFVSKISMIQYAMI